MCVHRQRCVGPTHLHDLTCMCTAYMQVFMVGPRFQGVKMIPPGMHFLSWQPAPQSGVAPVPVGSFLSCGAQQVVVRRWDPQQETLVALPDPEEVRSTRGARRHVPVLVCTCCCCFSTHTVHLLLLLLPGATLHQPRGTHSYSSQAAICLHLSLRSSPLLPSLPSSCTGGALCCRGGPL
jgi:hypothetical protein